MSCFYKHELSACCSAPVTSVNCRHCNLKWEKTWQKRTLNTREAACFSFVLIVVFLILWHRTGGNTSEFIPVNGSAVNSIGAKGDRTQRKLKKNKNKTSAGETEHLAVMETLSWAVIQLQAGMDLSSSLNTAPLAGSGSSLVTNYTKP